MTPIDDLVGQLVNAIAAEKSQDIKRKVLGEVEYQVVNFLRDGARSHGTQIKSALEKHIDAILAEDPDVQELIKQVATLSVIKKLQRKGKDLAKELELPLEG